MGVNVLRSNEGGSVNRTGDAIFIGEVRARNLAEGSKDVVASVVQFAAGAQTKGTDDGGKWQSGAVSGAAGDADSRAADHDRESLHPGHGDVSL